MRKLLTFGVIVLAAPVIAVIAIYAVVMCDKDMFVFINEDE